jgi:TolB-like protein
VAPLGGGATGRVVATLLAVGGVAMPAAAAKPTIAVMDLRARGVDAAIAGALSTEVTQALSKLGVFAVVSGEDLRRLLTLEETKAACTGEVDARCMAEIGGALGVELMVHGEVSKLGDRFVVGLTLLDASKASAIARERAEVGAASELLASTARIARVLVQPLLSSRRGALVLDVREPGARVEIDGRAVGVSPVPRQDLTMGPHEIRVEKEGFLVALRTVDVLPDEVQLEAIPLIPNVDFAARYEARARTTRAVAYGTAIGGVVLLGAAGVTRLVNDARFDGLVSRGELELRASCDGGAALGGRYCPTAAGRAAGVVDAVASIETWDSVALGAAVLGGASALTSIVLFVVGDEPGRYAPFATPSAASALRVAPLVAAGVGGVAVAGQF